MNFKNKYRITGATPNSGSFKNTETGEMVIYDHCKFYVEMPLKTGKGYSTVEYKVGVSSDFDKLFPVDLPAYADIEFEQVTSGNNKVQTNIVGIEFKKAV